MGNNTPDLTLAELAELIENIPDLILSIDYPSGDINYINSAALDTFGLPAGSVTNIKEISKSIPKDYRKKVMSRWKDVSEGILYPSITFKMNKADNKPRWIEGKNIFIKDDAGKTIRIHSILRDITERKRLEEEMMQSFFFRRTCFFTHHMP